ncbi:hypothetical protein G6M50_07780 [Agrobacterium rhizogenes]|jgi:hypothetical protein|nr:hypothetical protein [Rhizobium rhizogenes]NTJ77698.1 hypothetical protein [Rhizobium rhizogenes]
MTGKITRRIIFLVCAFLIVLTALGLLMRIYGPMAESHQKYGEITKV